MKFIEQYCNVVLFTDSVKGDSNFKPLNKILVSNHSRMKVAEQYCRLVLKIVVLT